MRRYLIVSIILVAGALIGAIFIIEGCVYRDEQETRRPSEAEIRWAVAVAENRHGSDTVYKRGGVWYFDRGGQRCKVGVKP